MHSLSLTIKIQNWSQKLKTWRCWFSGRSHATNCSLDMRIKYLRLTLDKVLTADSSDCSGNWSQKFILGLAGQITGFVFNVIIAVLGIYLSFRINKKFKRWEESEEIKILQKLE